ncbi:MAG: DNA-binding protein WhiA [Proteocatella sp.]|jgi:DNA-binding protein WhiA|nr:DNA-binding protein WhiA [Proteocatella sp.]NCB70655.1 DNA-binding protein WhiA [Clostridia bacterium]MBP7908287.1 DNA-binding protein WhiA [Proteocatella sp.]MBP8654000.1 DNA-binding protein WhiA [Proteocatella sp.]MBP9658676.1 DNA-binding protein WhiA [Proteocatella sp.]
MSFSAQVKNELARIIHENPQVQLSELSAIIRMSGTLKLMGFNKLSFVINTENPAIARKVFTLIKNCFGITVEIQVNRQSNLKRNNTYVLSVTYDQGANDILEKVGIIEKEGEHLSWVSTIPKHLVSRQDGKRAYLRGAFLGSGSVSDPAKMYHLEFSTVNIEISQNLRKLLNSYKLNAKIVTRKNNNVVYIKESEHITDLLNLMGAYNALMHLEDIKIKKQMRNDVNRLVNCETANLNKTVDTSMRQIECINYIMEKQGLDYLPENLHEIAMLRVENPDMSLKELGEIMETPLGKSGVNHRLKKIEMIAEELKEKIEK